MAAFVVLARPQPSVLRAAAMGAVALVALAGPAAAGLAGPGRRGARARCSSTRGWPRSYGFVLSVLATAGLVAAGAGRGRAGAARGVPRALAEALAVPLAAQLVCGPVIVLLAAG